MSERLKILVADDSSVARSMVRMGLAQSSVAFDADEVATGAETAARLGGGGYDVAFVDVHMPGISGPEAVLAAKSSGSDTLVVLMSSADAQKQSKLADLVDAYEYLMKPFQPAEVAKLLNRFALLRRKRGVLVVDDSATVRKLILRLIQQSKFSAVGYEAESAAQALQVMRDVPIEVVFLDFHMPGMDGLATIGAISEQFPKAKIAMMSTKDEPALLRQLWFAGAKYFLKKPFFAADVDTVLHEMFGVAVPSIHKHGQRITRKA